MMKFSFNHYSIDELYQRPFLYLFLFDCACAAAMAGVLALTQPLLRGWKRWCFVFCFVLSVSLIAPLSFGRAEVVLLPVGLAIGAALYGAIFALFPALPNTWTSKSLPVPAAWRPTITRFAVGIPAGILLASFLRQMDLPRILPLLAVVAVALVVTRPLVRRKQWRLAFCSASCFVAGVWLLASLPVLPTIFSRDDELIFILLILLPPHAIWFGVHGAIFALIAALWGVWLTKPIPAPANWRPILIRSVVGAPLGILLTYLMLYAFPTAWASLDFAVPVLNRNGSGEAWLIVGVVLLTLVIGLESAWIIGAGFTKNPAGRIVVGTAVSVYFIGLLWAMYSGVFAPFISTLIPRSGLGIAIMLFP